MGRDKIKIIAIMLALFSAYLLILSIEALYKAYIIYKGSDIKQVREILFSPEKKFINICSNTCDRLTGSLECEVEYPEVECFLGTCELTNPEVTCDMGEIKFYQECVTRCTNIIVQIYIYTALFLIFLAFTLALIYQLKKTKEKED